MSPDEESPRLEAVVKGGSRSSLCKPIKPLVYMFGPFNCSNFLFKFIEVVSKLSLLHDLRTFNSSIIDREMVFGIGNPALKPGLHEHSVDHISNSLEFVIPSIARSHSLGLFLLLLR